MRFSLLVVIPFIIRLSLSVSAQGSSAPQDLDRESERHFTLGVRFQTQGDLQNARLEYEAALRSAPRRVDKALAVNPMPYQVRYHLGAAYFQTQQFEFLCRRDFSPPLLHSTTVQGDSQPSVP